MRHRHKRRRRDREHQPEAEGEMGGAERRQLGPLGREMSRSSPCVARGYAARPAVEFSLPLS